MGLGWGCCWHQQVEVGDAALLLSTPQCTGQASLAAKRTLAQTLTSVTGEKSRLSGTCAVSLSRPLIPTSSFASVPTGLWYEGRSVVSGGVLAEVRDLCQGTFVSA